MAKLKLELEPDPRVAVFGISSHVNDYRLCWSMNLAMGLDMRRCVKDILDRDSGIAKEYAAFIQHDTDLDNCCHLVSNHCTDGVLIPEHHAYDYFLVAGEIFMEHNPKLISDIRSTEFVLAVAPLPFANIRKGYKLLPDI